ncbi:MAG TPA: FKBP-type peptidyl-prolyl cis-trans isomerase, partial [Puia sp.]|nr:FKBP-type peptidyl-prolyl cis-trans isomerase [Puia sp.]
MKKNKAYLLMLPLILLAAACNNSGLKKTKSGLLYKIMSDGKGEPAKRGEFLKINFVQRVRDSVLYNSADAVPTYARVDSVPANAYTAMEIFPMLRKGDSAIVVLLADSIQKKTGQPLPPFLRKKDRIIVSFKVLDVFANQDLVLKDRDASMEKQKEKEIKEVEDYLTKNKINTQKAVKGTYVEIKDPGTGVAVDSGKEVSVLYTGKSFPSGKVFETNTTPPNNKPLKFVIGRGRIIQGWDDGLRLLKKGGKATLYIPAYLAYDAQPGPNNKPFENLIFDVEVVDVADAPAEIHPKSPMMPPSKITPTA